MDCGLLLTDVGVGVGAAMAATDAAGACSRDRDRSTVAVFMVTPFVNLRCKWTLTLTP
jgi:hypothetical protein